jgi:RHS repeat-associated protein
MARFNYDSFGNLRNASGTGASLPGNAGGDFRFQGQWLDEATGLYNFRARYYDPETGQFMSYDPIELIDMEPESSNPYQFVYNNPHVYSDPTGMFTIAELNSTSEGHNILQTIQYHTGQAAREYMIDAAKDVVTDVAISALRSYIPFNADAIWNTITNTSPEMKAIKAGNKFYGKAGEDINNIFQEDQDFLDNIYIEVPVDPKSGKPSGNGTNIRDYFVFENGYPSWAFDRLGGNPNHPRPDYIIRPAEPKKLNERSWLIGDIKLSVNTIINSYFEGKKPQEDQYQAIAQHASNYGMRFAGFLTLYSGTSAQNEKIRREAVKDGIVVVILSLVQKNGFKAPL